MAFLSRDQLENMGFFKLGSNVNVSEKASIYNPEKIAIGSNVRIDDFSVISAGEGGVEIGDYVHVAVFCSLIGAGRIVLSDFVGISSRVSVYSSNDDYTGVALTGPLVPNELRKVQSADVIFEKHVIVGAGSIILPGVTLKEGSAVGALSLVANDCEEFTVYSGVPAKPLKARKKNLKAIEIEFLKSQ